MKKILPHLLHHPFAKIPTTWDSSVSNPGSELRQNSKDTNSSKQPFSNEWKNKKSKSSLLIPLLQSLLLSIGLIILLTFLSHQNVVFSAPNAPNSNKSVSPNTTFITGDILTDTVWTKAQSPYQVDVIQVRVAPTATLTVEPGVEVRFRQSSQLLVEGNLVALGTVTQPITFTGTTETPGWWDGIRIQGDIQGDIANLNRGSQLAYVTIAYGGNSYANLVLDDAHATVEQSTILGSGGHGIYTLGEGVVDVQDTRFISNTEYALMLVMGALDPVLT
ncbi:MAG: hypothetical protein D6706_15725, partial [Chloroflexi bacterium]